MAIGTANVADISIGLSNVCLGSLSSKGGEFAEVGRGTAAWTIAAVSSIGCVVSSGIAGSPDTAEIIAGASIA